MHSRNTFSGEVIEAPITLDLKLAIWCSKLTRPPRSLSLNSEHKMDEFIALAGPVELITLAAIVVAGLVYGLCRTNKLWTKLYSLFDAGKFSR